VTIVLRRLGGFVEAMGHRVRESAGAAAEVKRRCLATLARCESPPDEVRFLDNHAPARATGPGPVKCAERQRSP
jgi:hypothetical protein